jgi:hypothetical protein
LGEKPLELQRKIDYLQDQLQGNLLAVLEHPTYLGVSLMQVREVIAAVERFIGVYTAWTRPPYAEQRWLLLELGAE